MKTFIAVDLETTGLRAEQDCIIEIGALKYKDGKCFETFSELVKPPVSISPRITDITGIDDEMVATAPSVEVVMKHFLEFVGEEEVLLGHNLSFDFGFLKENAARMGINFQKKGLDTLKIARKMLKELPKRDLATVSRHYGVHNPRAHRAYEDAMTTAQVYFAMYEEFGEENAELFLPKPLQHKRKKTEPITDKQKKYLLDLLKCHKIQVETFFGQQGKNIDDLTKSEASRMIDKVITTYGRMYRY